MADVIGQLHSERFNGRLLGIVIRGLLGLVVCLHLGGVLFVGSRQIGGSAYDKIGNVGNGAGGCARRIGLGIVRLETSQWTQNQGQ